MELPETSADTIGGGVMELMGVIPKSGDTLQIGNYEITVLSAEPTHINRLVAKQQEMKPGDSRDQ